MSISTGAKIGLGVGGALATLGAIAASVASLGTAAAPAIAGATAVDTAAAGAIGGGAAAAAGAGAEAAGLGAGAAATDAAIAGGTAAATASGGAGTAASGALASGSLINDAANAAIGGSSLASGAGSAAAAAPAATGGAAGAAESGGSSAAGMIGNLAKGINIGTNLLKAGLPAGGPSPTPISQPNIAPINLSQSTAPPVMNPPMQFAPGNLGSIGQMNGINPPMLGQNAMNMNFQPKPMQMQSLPPLAFSDINVKTKIRIGEAEMNNILNNIYRKLQYASKVK